VDAGRPPQLLLFLPLPEVNQRYCRTLVPIGFKRERQVAGDDAGRVFQELTHMTGFRDGWHAPARLYLG
jgi:hypothetical protein